VAALTRITQVEQFVAATQLDQYLAVAYVVSIASRYPLSPSLVAGIEDDLVVRVLYLAAIRPGDIQFSERVGTAGRRIFVCMADQPFIQY